MINIYSTFAEDFIYSNNNKLVSRRKGGPAFFIENFFKRNDVKYKLFTGNIIEIKIQVSEKGEAGTIESNITTKFIPKEKQNGIILISTIRGDHVKPPAQEGYYFFSTALYGSNNISLAAHLSIIAYKAS